MITKEQIDKAMGGLFVKEDDWRGRIYKFDNAGPWRDEADAREIVWACLYLGTPVTDTLTTETWTALLRRVASIEDRT